MKSSKVFKEHDSGIEFIHHENHNWIHFVLCNCSNISGWINRKCFVDAFLGEISLFLILSETLKSSDIERDFSHFNRPFISFCWWIVRFNYPSILMGKIFITFDNLDMINLWQKWKKFIISDAALLKNSQMVSLNIFEGCVLLLARLFLHGLTRFCYPIFVNTQQIDIGPGINTCCTIVL